VANADGGWDRMVDIVDQLLRRKRTRGRNCVWWCDVLEGIAKNVMIARRLQQKKYHVSVTSA